MSGANGNLVAKERLALRSGAVISYRTPRMLAEVTGTVDAVGNLGTLILCDGARVGLDDYVRLLSASPTRMTGAMEGTAPRGVAPTDGGDADEGVSDGRGAVAPAGPPSKAAAADAPEYRRVAAASVGRAAQQEAPKKVAPPKPPSGKGTKGVPKTDHGLWLQAVEAILDVMASGMSRAAAVKQVAAGPMFATLKVNEHTYGWWALKFRREGKLARVFSGGRRLVVSTRPRSAAYQEIGVPRSGVPASAGPHSSRLLDPMTETAELRARCDAQAEDLERCRTEVRQARQEIERTTGELKTALAERDQARDGHRKAVVELTKVNQEFAARGMLAAAPTSGPAPMAETSRKRVDVDLDALVAEASALMSRWMTALALAQIGRDAYQDLHSLVSAVRGLPTLQEGGQG
jgi:hypothetical protein